MDTNSDLDPLRWVDPLSAEWVTVVVVAVLFMLALVNFSSPRKWRSLGRSMLGLRLGKQALRDEMDLRDRTFLGLLFIGTTLLALFAWQAMTVYGHGPQFPALLALVAAVVVAHYLMLRLLGGLISKSLGVEEYLYTGFLILILTGLVLLPVVVVVAYHADMRPTGIVVGGWALVVLLIYRWFRGAWIGVGEGIPLRYIFLYFCAAELLPVLLVIDHWRSTPSPLFHS